MIGCVLQAWVVSMKEMFSSVLLFQMVMVVLVYLPPEFSHIHV